MFKKSILKKISLGIICTTLFGMVATGCGKTASSDNAKSSDENVTLKLALWGEDDYKYMSETNKLADAYKKDHPNVTIELEHIAPKEYDNTMKIRNTAGELPDVFPIRMANLTLYGDVMVPLNDLKVAKENLYAKDTKINGNIIGIPQSVFNEYVYYNKKIFEEYNLKVPTTWNEFLDVCKAIKKGNKYIPLLLGLKDSWVDYPFNEFMPTLEAGDGQYYNKMAEKDEPFKKGEPFYDSYAKIQKLYDAKVCGSDPLGYGWDQQRAMFVAGKGAMLAAGSWYKADYDSNGGKAEDLGAFLLPTRNSKDDPFYATAMTEYFWGIPKTCEHQEEAKEFLNWFFSSDYHVELMKALKTKSTVKGIEYNDKFFADALKDVDSKPVVVFYNDTYNKVMNAMKFDVKGIGQKMMLGKESLDSIMNDLNQQWKKARKEVLDN